MFGTLCSVMGVIVKQTHVILACPVVRDHRFKLKITTYFTKARIKGLWSNCDICKSYLGGMARGGGENQPCYWIGAGKWLSLWRLGWRQQKVLTNRLPYEVNRNRPVTKF